MTLLQGAFSHNGFASKFDGSNDGGFRQVVAQKKVRGPILITHTRNDKAVGIALDAGINLFDTSPLYGATKSEIVLGNALRSHPRDSYYLSTKCGRYGNDDFDFSPTRVTRSVDESLQRLQTDHIDILFCLRRSA